MGKSSGEVAVGLSGGVDSSVAAALLKEEGYETIGLFMEIYDESLPVRKSEKHACYGPGEKQDLELVESVCKRLKIPLHRVDLRKEYRDHVITYFTSEYLSGKTPNPCAICNQRLKFGFLLEKAKGLGATFRFFATGHYARIRKIGGSLVLAKAVDRSKDQTYFLYGLKPEQLSRTLFPLALYTKKQVREIAKLLSLETADRPESQDFVSGGDYASFFKEGDIKEGDILNEAGHILGKHPGIAHYTVGQRRGLRVTSRKPLYVTKIDPQHNSITVSEKSRLYAKGLVVKDLYLHHVTRRDKPYKVKVKIRLKHEETPATVFPKEDNRAVILFDVPQAAVTPGQSAVFYHRDIVLGGGIIEETVGLAGAEPTVGCLERTEPDPLGHEGSPCPACPNRFE